MHEMLKYHSIIERYGRQRQLQQLLPLPKRRFRTGELQVIGLTFVSATYHVPVSLLKLRLMTTATVLWPIISKKVVTVKHPLMA